MSRPSLPAEILDTLRARGFRMTPQRRTVIEEILGSRGHIAPAEIVRRARGRMPGIDPSTVYRTLAVLDDIGVLSHSHSEGGVEYHRAERADHVHLVCSRCGTEQSLSAEDADPIARQIERRFGFRADLTHFAIAGLCRRCGSDAPPTPDATT